LTLPKPLLFCLLGRTASGMTTNTHALLDEFPDKVHPWMTMVTREQRPDDRPDSYRSVSLEVFEAMWAKSELYERDSTQNGEWYGKRLEDLTWALSTPGILVFHINYLGFEQILKDYPQLVRGTWLDVSREISERRYRARAGKMLDAKAEAKLLERLDKGDTEDLWLRSSALPRKALGEMPATALRVIDGEPAENVVRANVRSYFLECTREFGHEVAA
jgi:guanylate kinase